MALLHSSHCLASSHKSNHAVIVSSSRYWFNYRHAVNALSIYQLCKRHGIPDSNIVLMLADEYPTNARNPIKNTLWADGRTTLYDTDTQIDFRGDEVTVETMLQVLLGKRRGLHTDSDSNILIYWTGHGGDQFFKFQDFEEIASREIASALKQMHSLKRYNEVLFIADTCQAFTLGDELGDVPNVYFVGSSLKGENSYAHHSDSVLGLSVIERYTHALVQYVGKRRDLSGLTLSQGLVDHLTYEDQRAHVGMREGQCDRPFHTIPMNDFFANIQSSPNARNFEPLYPTDKRPLWDALAKIGGATHHDVTDRASNTSQARNDDMPAVNKFRGVEPNNGLFLAALLLFVGAIVILSLFV